MIDKDGFRLNVGIIVMNKQGQLLWARRRYMHEAWQFPQGGIQERETPEEAMYRELDEELGLSQSQVKILAESKHWFSYRLPKMFVREYQKPVCIGQKQRWFLLQLTAGDYSVNLNKGDKPEFDAWRWVDYWYPLQQVVDFKKPVYEKALNEFLPILKTMSEELR